jgi:hypothetical protein
MLKRWILKSNNQSQPVIPSAENHFTQRRKVEEKRENKSVIPVVRPMPGWPSNRNQRWEQKTTWVVRSANAVSFKERKATNGRRSCADPVRKKSIAQEIDRERREDSR